MFEYIAKMCRYHNFNKRIKYAGLAAFALSLLTGPAHANVSLPAKGFSDNMVLQRGTSAPLWGLADPGETVTVTFRGKDVTAQTGTDGKWTLKVETGTAIDSLQLIIKATNTLTLKNVAVGEVWLAGGQSNMEHTMTLIGGPNLDSLANANYPQIRFVTMRSEAGGSGADGKWHACDPISAKIFSATSYYFAKELYLKLHVPIGIIVSSLGGTEVERWIDPVTIKATMASDTDQAKGDLYKQSIAPMVPYAIKGVIWYQGESNGFILHPRHANWNAGTYRMRFGDLIKGWRNAWDQGDFPFYYVQISNYGAQQTKPVDTCAWAMVREAQRVTLGIPNTGMAVTIDIGMDSNIHPKNKWDVGKRLALNARALTYGEKSLAYSSPIYRSMEIRGKTIRCHFMGAEGGLKTMDGSKPKGFALAGEDNKWVWADAEITYDTVVVSSAVVPAPTKVRYGWADNPIVSIFNGANLPMSPFQTEGPQIPLVLGRRDISKEDAGIPGKNYQGMGKAKRNFLGRIRRLSSL
jgi:sialate O-acetylesterase